MWVLLEDSESRDVHKLEEAWGDGSKGKSVWWSSVKSSAQKTHKKMGVLVEVPVTLMLRFWGTKTGDCCDLLAGRFSDRPCLKGIRWKV